MARRYDSRTTIFSPEGRLYQVEYAMEAIGNAGSAVGILAKDGVVLAAEKRITSKVRLSLYNNLASLMTSSIVTMRVCLQLLDTNAVGVRREKMYKLDGHVACAVAGITGKISCLCNRSYLHSSHYVFCTPTADANILINTCRLAAQRYTFAYQEPIPVEQLVRTLCDNKQVCSLTLAKYHQHARFDCVHDPGCRATHNMEVCDLLGFPFCMLAGRFATYAETLIGALVISVAGPRSLKPLPVHC